MTFEEILKLDGCERGGCPVCAPPARRPRLQSREMEDRPPVAGLLRAKAGSGRADAPRKRAA